MGTVSKNFTINPKPVVVKGITAENKTYDGTTSATLSASGVTIEGIVTGDDLTVSSATGEFTGAAAGTDKDVNIIGITLDGTDKSNYILASSGQQTTAKADINKKPVTISGVTATNRDYEQGNKEVSLSGGKINGIENNDDVTIDLTIAMGYMADENAGEDKPVTVTGIKLKGADADNYDLTTQPTGVTVTINKITPDFIEPKAIANLVENGSSLALVEAGVSKNGTVLYSVNDSVLNKFPADTDFSADIPEADKAGHYTVWYKVKGNENYNDIAAKSFEVTIEAPEQKPLDGPQKPTESPVQPTVIIDNPEPANTPIIEKNDD